MCEFVALQDTSYQSYVNKIKNQILLSWLQLTSSSKLNSFVINMISLICFN